MAALWAFVVIFCPPEELIQEVEFGDRTYKYTCRALYDGSIDMFLYECEGQTKNSCTLLQESSVDGYPCGHITLRIQDNGLIWGLESRAWTIFTYAPD